MLSAFRLKGLSEGFCLLGDFVAGDLTMAHDPSLEPLPSPKPHVHRGSQLPVLSGPVRRSLGDQQSMNEHEVDN